MKKSFDALRTKDRIIDWIREYFKENGPSSKAVIGISGGKDSSVVAALCVEALGKERVFGVLMPQGDQKDIDASFTLVNHLDIPYCIVNIGETVKQMMQAIEKGLDADLTTQAITNIPARIRMTTLYAVSATISGRVANTCNLSEDYVGYATKYGDAAGDFSPLSDLTVQEVKAIGRALGLPESLVEKTPIDGLCGKTDEDNLGFTYAVLDKYIRTGVCEDEAVKAKIDRMNECNLHKLLPMPKFVL